MTIVQLLSSSMLLLTMFDMVDLRRLHHHLPSQWYSMCHVKRGLSCLDPETDTRVVDTLTKKQPICLVCNVSPNNIWNFQDFRSFVQNSSMNYAMNYAMKVRCHDGGNITLPFPMRAAGLEYISISNCLIVNYMVEYFDPAINDIPDTLVHTSIKDSVIYVDMMQMMAAADEMGNMTKAAKCGPEKNIIVSIARNISYTFAEMPETIQNEVFSNFTSYSATKFIRGLLTSHHSCVYSKLIEMDLSVSKTRGAKFDSIIVNNADYPTLQTLKVSDSLLSKIPERFNDWRLYFPRLMTLDLSHNKITDFSTVLDYGNQRIDSNVGTLDLRHNHISTITLGDLESLRYHRFVKIDIRNNPFKCDCKMRDFIDYFSRSNDLMKGGNASQYDYFRRLKCQEPLSLKGRTVVDLSPYAIGC